MLMLSNSEYSGRMRAGSCGRLVVGECVNSFPPVMTLVSKAEMAVIVSVT